MYKAQDLASTTSTLSMLTKKGYDDAGVFKESYGAQVF
jgi:hypothetical protein